jgi:hypothetical protein
MDYEMEYIDFSYAQEGQDKLTARGAAGWKVEGSTLAFPYAFILWSRGGASGKRDAGDDHGSSSPKSPGA